MNTTIKLRASSLPIAMACPASMYPEPGELSVRTNEEPAALGTAVHDALARHLGRDNDTLLAERYDRMRRVTLKAVRDTAASFLADALPQARTCVLAGAPLLAAANAKLATPLAIEPLLDEE